MGWIYDVGYDPAYAHEGWTALVLDDGTDTSSWSAAVTPRITGWRAACDCGWRSGTFYARAEWPSNNGLAPEEVEGWESDTGCYTDWEAHVRLAVPELELYELIRTIEDAQSRVEPAVRKALAAGASWATIGGVTHMTGQATQQRWAGRESSPRR